LGFREEKMKIHFMCIKGLENFLLPIIAEFNQKEGYEVTVDIGSIDLDNCRNADVIWIEWANDLAVKMTNEYWDLLSEKRVILRLHSYEVFVDQYLKMIRWENITDIVFVCYHVQAIFKQKMQALEVSGQLFRLGVPQTKPIHHVIYNGVSPKKFPYRRRDIERPASIGYVGYVNHKKGPMLLLHSFAAILKRIETATLHIAGTIQEERYKVYFDHMIKEMGLQKNVFLYSWVQDVPKFLKKCDYIISTSVFEGHPLNVLEAVSAGCIPLIHNFKGSRELYPEDYIWTTIDELVEKFEHYYSSPVSETEDYRRLCSKWIQSVYPLTRQIELIEDLLHNKWVESPILNPKEKEEVVA
jgi:glycosyltransferase involved in cell wall biosynthesis